MGLRFLLIGSGLLVMGCAPRSTRSPAIIEPARSIAGLYRCAPHRRWESSEFGLHATDGFVVVSDSAGLHWLPLDDSGDRYCKPAVLMTTSLWTHSFGQTRASRTTAFSVTEIDGSGGVNAYVIDDGSIQASWRGTDAVEMEFSEKGELWFTSSYGDLVGMRIEDGSRTFENKAVDPWSRDWEFVPGAYGRLVKSFLVGNDGPQDLRWFDAVSGKDVVDPVLNSIGPEDKVWVDQGDVLVESVKGVRDLGHLAGTTAHLSRRDAVGFSPWDWRRSEDRKTLVVRSIFKDGPEFNLHSPSLWSQDAFCTGLHALVAPDVAPGSETERSRKIRIYDLRSGLIGATIEFEEGRDSEFLVTLADGTCAGTTGFVQRRHGALAKLNQSAVARAVQDLLIDR